MKPFWIAVTVVLLGTWLLGSKANATGTDQTRADESPVPQAQSSNPSANPQDAAKAQGSSVAANAVTPTAAAEVAASPAAPANAQSRGSYMLVELTKSLKAKKLKPGDRVKAEVAQDVVAHGKVIIPVETELVGHVTEVSVRDGATAESRLGIVFDRILLKHYHDINFQAVVQAVAPPVIKQSRVDQPSQMLPPSMVGGGLRQSGPTPIGGSRSAAASRGQVSTSAPTTLANNDTTTLQTPLTVKQTPANNASSGAAAQLEVGPGGKPLSIGMPRGVTGLKGLSLSTVSSASTPGPVIVSSTDNVKLESGTQILLHVLSVETPNTPKKSK